MASKKKTGGIEIRVPDIGDFTGVDVVDVLVDVGDTLTAEAPMITLETDKAVMDVPSPQAGKVLQMKVSKGDKVSEGDVILVLEPAATAQAEQPPRKSRAVHEQGSQPVDKPHTAKSASTYDGSVDMNCELLVLGAGPGGYTAAFRAADLGLQTVLVERYDTLGGVCLNVGCIPSKALLHVAKVIEDARFLADHGVRFGNPEIDRVDLRNFKDSVVGRLTGGLKTLARQRKVEVVHGSGSFISPHHLSVETSAGKKIISFEKCIIAAGSSAATIPGLPDDPRIMDSTGALELSELPERMLVIGGGIIGLEMATVYDALGVKVSVVEMTDSLIPEADRDLVRPLQKRIQKRYEQILLGTKVSSVKAVKEGIRVSFEGDNAPQTQVFGRVLVATGRRPNGRLLDAEKAGVQVDEHGFIPADKQQRTNIPHIFAIGDIAGNPMLAHKASHEGKVAAEVAAGLKRAFDARVIPSVAYTDPEVAWVGVTEKQATEQGISIEKASFPWAASGRSLSLGRDEGVTKLLFDPQSGRVVGAGIVGPSAGDLISEVALAIEMGCDAADIGLTIHPHPTLSETVAFAAEAYDGTLTDLYIPKKSPANH